MPPFVRLIASAALLASASAAADDFCVHNDTEFRAALVAAQFAPPPNRILLVAGWTYALADTMLDNGEADPYFARSMKIEGGYDGLCEEITDLDAASTIVSGAGTNGIWIGVHGDFTLSNLTVSGLGGRLRIQASEQDDSTIRLLHTRFIDGLGVMLRQYEGDNGLIRVENSVFTRMRGNEFTSQAALDIEVDNPDDGSRVVLVNNTISGNRRYGLFVDTGGTVLLYNNIVWGNDTIGENHVDWRMDGDSTTALAVDNIVGTRIGGYMTGSFGNTSDDPQFVSATNLDLAVGSPARDSGTSGAPYGLAARDVEGGGRVVGTAVDRGAYEADSSGATILLVTNTNDSGVGSLRAAILDANANPSTNIIGFNIPGACPRTIALASELPAITDSLLIRGYTQPGASANTSVINDNATICVELAKAGSGVIANGLRFAPPTATREFSVSGLSIGGFGNGIAIDGADSGSGSAFEVWGNFIGLAADGSGVRANVAGVAVSGRASGTVGGDDIAQRNLIGGNLGGVRLAGEQATRVTGNYIGTSRSGNSARGNGFGVAIYGDGQQVRDNLISGNTADAVHIESASSLNLVRGNSIGLKSFAFCLPPPCQADWELGNGGNGVSISGASYQNTVFDNSIAWNGGAGIRVTGNGSLGNYFSSNRVYENAGLGIDLGAQGVDPVDNDATTADAPNRGLNYPVIASAGGGERAGTVQGYLQSTNGAYLIEFHVSEVDPSLYGEGRHLVGTTTVAITGAPAGASAQGVFSAPIAWTSNLADRRITAVAIDEDGNTSEFSLGQAYAIDDMIFADEFEAAP